MVTLSEKRIKTYEVLGVDIYRYSEIDVKDFIKNIKNEVLGDIILGQDSRRRLNKKINALAGENLW